MTEQAETVTEQGVSEAIPVIVAEPVKDKRTGQFIQGHSGNPAGRPKGARSRLSEAFLQDVQTAWEQRGMEAIQATIDKRPWDFVKVISNLLPKDMNLNITHYDNMTPEQLRERAAQIDATIGKLIEHLPQAPQEPVQPDPVLSGTHTAQDET